MLRFCLNKPDDPALWEGPDLLVMLDYGVEVFCLGFHQDDIIFVLIKPDGLALWEGPDWSAGCQRSLVIEIV